MLKQLDFKSRRSLYFSLGKSEINSDEVLNILLPKKVNTNKIINFVNRKDRGISIKGLKPGVAIKYGRMLSSIIW